ncbi:hypothetical protein Tco_0249489, partial [Tanacetum coccineum]
MRGRPGIFLGYPPGTKGYKIYDLEDKKIIVSRDTQFREEHFPFKGVISNCQHGDPFEPTEEYVDSRSPRTETKTSKINETQSDELIESHSPLQDHDHEVELNEANETQPGSFSQQDSDHDICGSQSHIDDKVNQETSFEQERARRVRTQPARLKDFHVHLPPSIDSSRPDSNQGHSTVHPISNFVSYDNFSSSHKMFFAAIESHDEPKS